MDDLQDTSTAAVATSGETAKKDKVSRRSSKNALSQNIDLNDQETFVDGAKRLKDFITENGLASNISGKQYVKAEGWQFLYALAGIRARVLKPVRRWENIVVNEITYECECYLYNADNEEVGYGFAVVSNLEAMHSRYEEFALASYAQTRALGKAGRNRFAFIMALAGYAPTPLEEMDQAVAEKNSQQAASGVVSIPPPPLAGAPAPPALSPASPPISAPVVSAPVAEPVISGAVVQEVANPSSKAAPAPPVIREAVPAPAPVPTMQVHRDEPAGQGSEDSISDAQIVDETPAAAAAAAPLPPVPDAPKKRASRKKAEETPAAVAEPTAEAAVEKLPFGENILNAMVKAVVENGQAAFDSVVERLPVYEISDEHYDQLQKKLADAGYNLADQA